MSDCCRLISLLVTPGVLTFLCAYLLSQSLCQIPIISLVLDMLSSPLARLEPTHEEKGAYGGK